MRTEDLNQALRDINNSALGKNLPCVEKAGSVLARRPGLLPLDTGWVIPRTDVLPVSTDSGTILYESAFLMPTKRPGENGNGPEKLIVLPTLTDREYLDTIEAVINRIKDENGKVAAEQELDKLVKVMETKGKDGYDPLMALKIRERFGSLIPDQVGQKTSRKKW
ncbi:hypothetical protein A2715_02350 [Candidatus Woesebacteria bacterium RIFCSPHIGHO2_01_FULL_39_32]|uniref:Uncharacterized protein n=1 Tax=Candidatus Woesebacteria bacterium RIFCSPLOWO2_01_FULL_39_25 TaxID=1802521 RepID=A0A1F8BJP7_9BACT|nr:MAG: hypothetical protein A2124_01770 [Candidatus Woesebacteria bacterium GWB1_37_5]OGM23991.1 MAG: hypothetical protein A2715_02350 [Candidatus Woesebacteria bacterium RIFCSPHIGHO2_01_FULL_39_32]OGM37497.1 MAG: hypothetical protein A3F01_03585 [Candidatus Woesebacteria bacterium RIFCSPHIGHO2_12_FULL_38_11]OGM64180.1 MAG: hypothetical protein A2893_03590 [Candidatus Woesebacteria bacterium RIFCSPLOWO2_01_FULL_39_25]